LNRANKGFSRYPSSLPVMSRRQQQQQQGQRPATEVIGEVHRRLSSSGPKYTSIDGSPRVSSIPLRVKPPSASEASPLASPHEINSGFINPKSRRSTIFASSTSNTTPHSTPNPRSGPRVSENTPSGALNPRSGPRESGGMPPDKTPTTHHTQSSVSSTASAHVRRSSYNTRLRRSSRQSLSPPPPAVADEAAGDGGIPPVPPLPDQVFVGKHRQMPSGPRAVPPAQFRSVSNSQHQPPPPPPQSLHHSSSSRSISSSLPPKTNPQRLMMPSVSQYQTPPSPNKQHSDFPLPHVPSRQTNQSNHTYRRSLIHAHEFSSTPNLSNLTKVPSNEPTAAPVRPPSLRPNPPSQSNSSPNLAKSPYRPLNRPAHVHPPANCDSSYYADTSPQKKQHKHSSHEDLNGSRPVVTRMRSKSTAAKQWHQVNESSGSAGPGAGAGAGGSGSPRSGQTSVAATRRMLVSPFTRRTSQQTQSSSDNNLDDTTMTTSTAFSSYDDSNSSNMEENEVVEVMKKLVTSKTEDSSARRRMDELKRNGGMPLPKNSMTPAIATKHFKLNLYEKGEILDFRKVYFCGRPDAKKISGDIRRAVNNYGFDDEKGDYKVVPGDHLAYRYEILGVLGKGSFGKVLKCVDHRTGKLVAVKMIINRKRFHMQALVEADILKSLSKGDPQDKCHLIRYTDHFNFRDHLCISTELLGINLYELIKYNGFRGLPLTLVKHFTRQMLEALDFLASKKIIHCDLKPENVLLSDPERGKVKIIDFGSSCYESERVYTYIQSRFYRSPEVILGMMYDEQIDIWSLGCIISELLTGRPLFMGENEQEQIACIMEIFGVPDKALISKCTRRKLFFDSMGNPRPSSSSKRKRQPNSRTMQQELKTNDPTLIDFISSFLSWNPRKRTTPKRALQHELLTSSQATAVPPPPPPPHHQLPKPQISTPDNPTNHRHSMGYKASPRQMQQRATPNNSRLFTASWNGKLA
jgi:serine/threonine protein kinase